MFYVFYETENGSFAAQCKTEKAAIARANEEFDRGCNDIEVQDNFGDFIYAPSELFLMEAN